ncbi:MAG: ATP-dependent RecD-like DNA helicase [Eubacterium sp.]|nr:ATP-dependent RecD-like DNA helicase [Eubacterium sp.]
MQMIEGNIAEIIFRNDENGYTVAVLECEDEFCTIVGNLPACNKGSRFRLVGNEKVHPIYGEQFAFSEFEEILPEGETAIFDFLSSGVIKGIGPSTAAAIIDAFGEEALRIMEESPDRLIEVKGIGKKTAETISESFAMHRQFADISLAFQKYGVSSAQALKLFKLFGAQSIEIVEANPYRLVEEVRGFGFRKADEIAEKIGIKRDSDIRIKSGIKYALLFFSGEGNTYMPREELCDRVSELLDVSRELVEEALIELAFEGTIKIDSLDSQDVIYLYSFFLAEQKVCQNLLRISEAALKPLSTNPENLIHDSEISSGIELSEQQKQAVLNSINHGISLITGGPGTGKTTIINSIIRIFEAGELKTAIAAPTGRAAKRITETSGHYASTIHRLLEYYFSDDSSEMVFGKSADEQLDYDVVIIDESSMIDLMLMKALTDAIKTGTRLILIGDCDQLPPVGAGDVLHDLIESEFAFTTKLVSIFRQAEESLIVVNAHRINSGEYPYLNEREKDFFFMERSDERDILSLIKELASSRLEAYYEDIDTIKDIQVLTPVRKGNLGTHNLNEQLQEVLNPKSSEKNEKIFGDKTFREGDKVMQIRNNYQIGWKRKSDFSEGQGVFNGDVGYILKIDSETNEIIVIFDEDKFVTYEFGQLEELELAYAMTVHKSQGSEFKIVIMPISRFPHMLATRNLLYTAVTRGKSLVVLCGMQRQMENMIDNNRIKLRYSGLKQRLKNLMGRSEVLSISECGDVFE